MKNKLSAVLAALMMLTSSLAAKSETYFKADFTSGNAFVDLLGIMATYGVNKGVDKGIVMDNYLTFNSWSVDVDNPSTGMYIHSSSHNIDCITSVKFPDLLNGLGTGFKVGYKQEVGSFIKNWAMYGSIHATYNYILMDVRTPGSHLQEYDNSLLRCSPGIGANVTFGKDTSPVSVMLDVNLRYDIPVYYKGDFGSGAGCINSGLSPRVSVIVGGPHLKKLGMNIGVFVEGLSYNLFKKSEFFTEMANCEGVTFGINFTMFPWK